MMRQAARCYHSADLRTVQRDWEQFLDRWRPFEPAAIRAFAIDLDRTLTYLRLPPSVASMPAPHQLSGTPLSRPTSAH